jgi:hypothetical protein
MWPLHYLLWVVENESLSVFACSGCSWTPIVAIFGHKKMMKMTVFAQTRKSSYLGFCEQSISFSYLLLC